MKLLTCLTITIVLLAPQQTPTPCANEAQAKQELNEAARAYREGNFAEAQAHSERALLLDPQNRAAPMYLARTIHAQYKPRDSTPENLEKARQAILAYQRLLERPPDNEEAFKAVAFLYDELKEDELWREWMLQRAGNASLADDKRAEAFVALAARDWNCAFKITDLPTNKVTTVRENKASVSFRMPKEGVDFERAKECANRGLVAVNMAITLKPEDEAAWSYKTNLLLELAKLAEMAGDITNNREFRRQYEEALKETARLANRSQPNP